jgi:predicted ATPase with chaperone activity
VIFRRQIQLLQKPEALTIFSRPLEHLNNCYYIKELTPAPGDQSYPSKSGQGQLFQLREQENVKRAMEVAAVGYHKLIILLT